MTQECVADAPGVSRRAVSKWESGASDPSPTNLTALADLFKQHRKISSKNPIRKDSLRGVFIIYRMASRSSLVKELEEIPSPDRIPSARSFF